MGSPIRAGILGAAWIGPWGLIEPAAARDDIHVVCVAARDPARARVYAASHGIPEVEADYASMIARGDIDLIYVALPISAHAEWSIRALEAGKAVLCEKPFAMNAEQAREMVAAARRAGRPLLEAVHYRHHAVTRRAEALLRDGALGKLVSAEGVFTFPVADTPTEIRWNPALGGGAIMDDGCYPIHALRTLIGCEPRVVSARSRFVRGVDAETWAELDFDGVPATIHVALETDTPASRIEIVGERGRLLIRNFIVPHLGARFEVEIDGKVHLEPTEGPSTYAAQLDHLMKVLRGEAEPLTGGADAIGNMAVIDAIKRVARPTAEVSSE